MPAGAGGARGLYLTRLIVSKAAAGISTLVEMITGKRL
jgi:hypothetical protein